MWPGPVFNAELLTTSRRARYYALRFGFGLFLLFLFWINRPETRRIYYDGADSGLTISEVAAIGSQLFYALAVAQAVGVLLMTPAMVAGAITEEKQRKTLHYLLASRLTSAEIVLGKMAARMMHILAFLTLALPFLAVLPLYGGVNPSHAFMFYALCASTAFQLGSLAMLMSVWTRRTRDAVFGTYLFAALWYVVPVVAAVLLFAAGGVAFREYWGVPDWASSALLQLLNLLGATSPLAATIGILSGGMAGFPINPSWSARDWFVGLLTGQLVGGALMLAVAVARLRPTFRDQEGGKPATRLGERLRRLARWNPRLFPRPPCGDRAMLWKETRVFGGGALVRAGFHLVSAIVIVIFVVYVYNEFNSIFGELLTYGYAYRLEPGDADRYWNPGWRNGWRSREGLNGLVRGSVGFLYVMLGLGVAMRAAASIAGERERDTWTTLLGAPLSAGEILAAKAVGAVWHQRFMIGLIAAFALFAGVMGAIHWIVPFVAAPLMAAHLAATAMIGMFWSLRSRSTLRALTASMLTLFVLNGGYLVLCIPFNIQGYWILAGVAPFVLGGSLMSIPEFAVRYGGSRMDFPDSLQWSALELTAVSGFVYGALAVALWLSMRWRFDALNDRPNADRPTPPVAEAEFLARSAAGPRGLGNRLRRPAADAAK